MNIFLSRVTFDRLRGNFALVQIIEMLLDLDSRMYYVCKENIKLNHWFLNEENKYRNEDTDGSRK